MAKLSADMELKYVDMNLSVDNSARAKHATNLTRKECLERVQHC